MRAKDLRAQARNALRGKWGVAVLVGLVGSILSGGISAGNAGGATGGEAGGYLDFINHDIMIMATTVLIVSMLLALFIGGVVQFGLCHFHTKLIKGEEVRFGNLFAHFHRIWAGICYNFVVALFILLWSLLLIVPGIIAAYRYAMVPYLMAEFPDLGVLDAIRESKRLMKGNKWRLFCLELSFFGWMLLGTITVIGHLWVTPYMSTARAAFYMDVTGRGPRPEAEY